MTTKRPLFPQRDGYSTILGDGPSETSRIRAFGTRDHEEIRRWARRHHAEPSTGEATASGPRTVSVNDGGAGIRFNFPGAAPFRPIDWAEWFENFDRHELMFVYEEEVAQRAYTLWEGRQGGHGHDQDDWFEAERQLGAPGGAPSARYRFVKANS